MPVTDSQKIDFLWKKVIFGVTETNITGKDGANESISSPITVYDNSIWANASSIPIPAPLTSSGVVDVRTNGSSIRCKVDGTVAGNKTWIAVVDYNASEAAVSNRYKNFIPPSFDPSYMVKVYSGNPSSGGVLLNSTVTNQEWIFDYASGTLHFPNSVPASVNTNGIWIQAYKYNGNFGVSGSVVNIYEYTPLNNNQITFEMPLDAVRVLQMYINGVANNNFTFVAPYVTFNPTTNLYGVRQLDRVWFTYTT